MKRDWPVSSDASSERIRAFAMEGDSLLDENAPLHREMDELAAAGWKSLFAQIIKHPVYDPAQRKRRWRKYTVFLYEKDKTA